MFATYLTIALCAVGIALIFAIPLCRMAADADRRMELESDTGSPVLPEFLRLGN